MYSVTEYAVLVERGDATDCPYAGFSWPEAQFHAALFPRNVDVQIVCRTVTYSDWKEVGD